MIASINYRNASPLCKTVEVIAESVWVCTSLIMQVDVVLYYSHRKFTSTKLSVVRPLRREKAQ
jgi:hypothetical protein